MRRYILIEIDWGLMWYDIKDFWKYKILRKSRPVGSWKWYGAYGLPKEIIQNSFLQMYEETDKLMTDGDS